MPFSDAVRQQTRDDHERAERSPFIGALIGGHLHRRAHAELLRALLPVYVALEQELAAHAEEASIGLFDHRRLDRRDRIADDLRTVGQDPVSASATLLPATSSYVGIVRASVASPQRLLAHHYTRYLGDMAGGRIIASRLMSQYDIAPEALTYYDFSALGDVHHYRRQYKAILDLVPWSDVERAEFVAECIVAYRANAILFDELAAHTGMSTGAPSTAGSFLSRERRHSIR
ncbi:MAG: hypothetical protein QG661_2890 [Actinomycetota bacterium]|nr:hypothetical protein [Actinomycetota bacterium]